MPQASTSKHLHLLFHGPAPSKALTINKSPNQYKGKCSIQTIQSSYINININILTDRLAKQLIFAVEIMEAWTRKVRNTHLMLRWNCYQRLPIEVSNAAQKVTKCNPSNFQPPFTLHLSMTIRKNGL